MKTNLEIKNLESQVVECYSYFMNNYQNTNFDALESMVLKLQRTLKNGNTLLFSLLSCLSEF
mgnify:CR=1 FL=1